MGRKGVHASEASQADLALSGAGSQRRWSEARQVCLSEVGQIWVNLLPLRGDEMMMEGEA